MTIMNTILWDNPQDHSIEHFSLIDASDYYVLKGTVICLLEQKPACISYHLRCTRTWKTRSVVIQQQWANTENQMTIEVDDNQHWTCNDEPVAFADGLVDIDLGITPATNTLPIRRLSLVENDAKETTAVWIRFPELSLEPLSQRYTRTGSDEYIYDSLRSGFRATLHVDTEGIVVKYGDLWKRIP